MKIVGSSKQEGTPKPDNPVQITNETILIITDKEGNKKEMPFKYEKILKEGDKIEKINGEWCLVRRKPMNDIEILENLEKYISFANKQENFSHDTDYKWHKELASMIENLIQRNKDLEEIEKEHKEENGRLRKENINLKEKIIRQQEQLNIANKKILAQKGQLKVVNNSYIPKSKVKEKIEELNKEEKKALKGTKGQDRYSIKLEYMHKRNALQELLEESENNMDKLDLLVLKNLQMEKKIQTDKLELDKRGFYKIGRFQMKQLQYISKKILAELKKKDKIINLMAERLVEDKEWFYSEFDNYTKQDFIEYFVNKVEEDK